ncbi:MAG: hypothetical protein ACYCUF_01010 [Acidimicrobiales bacterium]
MQQTITVPPSVNAKTAQRHDYPSKTWRASFARRSAAGLAGTGEHLRRLAAGPGHPR